jgi:hypothetical protein
MSGLERVMLTFALTLVLSMGSWWGWFEVA